MKNVSRIELADVVRRFGPSYIKSQGKRILPSQIKALNDIARCRTKALGGKRYRCTSCQKDFWVYHSCRNRACPACHGRDTRLWLRKREAQLLGCDYYHIIVTAPSQIRASFLADQKRIYSLFMKTVAESVIGLAKDERFVGATPAILMVLHSWATDIQYHPHVHLLVSAGGVSDDGEYWVRPRNEKWLMPVKALSKLVRNSFRKRLKRLDPEAYASLPEIIWKDGWNSFCKRFGKGEKAVLNYLGRYVFRIAITNARIVAMDDSHVTFKCKNRKTGKSQAVKLRGEEFLRRFVMHILPKGFHKVRYYGLWHPGKREFQIRAKLLFEPVSASKVKDLLETLTVEEDISEDTFKPECPHCGCAEVLLIADISWSRSP